MPGTNKDSNPVPPYFTFITVLQGKYILDEETEVNDQIMSLRAPPVHLLSEPKCSATLLLVCSSQSLNSNGASRALCLGRGVSFEVSHSPAFTFFGCLISSDLSLRGQVWTWYQAFCAELGSWPWSPIQSLVAIRSKFYLYGEGFRKQIQSIGAVNGNHQDCDILQGNDLPQGKERGCLITVILKGTFVFNLSFGS